MRAAENAGFTLATFEDSILPPGGGDQGRVDAVNRASFVAATTTTIGLVPVVETTYAEPFHTSSQLATLDYSSRGRGGWIAARVADPAAAAAWGRPVLADSADLDREQRDSITVVRDLWDSWEDDAVIRDYATRPVPGSGQAALRRLRGRDVHGEGARPSCRRPPQGQLVVFGYRGRSASRSTSSWSPSRITTRLSTRRAAAAALTFVEIDVTLDTARHSAAERLAALNDHDPST